MDTTGDFLKIIAPMPDSPASNAGLKFGDLIIAVDKVDMTGNPGDAVLSKVVGTAAPGVVLTIQREGEEQPFDVTITRAEITVPQAEGKMLDNNVACASPSIPLATRPNPNCANICSSSLFLCLPV